MTDPDISEIREALRDAPLTWEELEQLPEADRLGLGLFFGTADVRRAALAYLVNQMREELRAESNVIPIRPDIRTAAAPGVRPENALAMEQAYLKRKSELNAKRINLHRELAEIENDLNQTENVLSAVREVKLQNRNARRMNGASPTLHLTTNDGEHDGPAAA